MPDTQRTISVNEQDEEKNVRPFPANFLWGASTSAHQIEGNNVLSDWWRNEQTPQNGLQRSGDALDSYHRYADDMRLLANAGLNSYRFSIEWARVEPVSGHFSRAELAHYRLMIDTALELGLEPVVTLHHFSNPVWFADQGGWLSPDAVPLFTRYVEEVSSILDGVKWVCTINEPNMLAQMTGLMRQVQENGLAAVDVERLPAPPVEIGNVLIAAHHAAVAVLKEHTTARVGWTIAQQSFLPTPGNEAVFKQVKWEWEDLYHDAARGDDFLGIQSYTSRLVDENGPVPHPPRPDNTITGWAYRPDALGIAIRQAWEATGGVPLLVTENGIATADDSRRIEYTREALGHLADAMDEGIDVRGYLHWSALDNFEWGHWEPTFGLIAVDRETFKRTPKPSLGWLGSAAKLNGI